MNEDEVKQIMRDAIDQNPEGTVWHVNTKHLVAFAQMVESNAKTECKQRKWVGLTDEDQDASLIAAAPDLLEALQAMVKIWEGPRDSAAIAFGYAVVRARKAIAKAKN